MTRQLGLFLLLAGAAVAQPPQGPGPGAPPPQPPPPGGAFQPRGGPDGAPKPARRMERNQEAPPPPRANRPPMEKKLMPGLPGRWWDNPDMVQKLALSTDQQKKMGDIFQQNRLRLVDLNATLQKDELTMEPLVSADQPDETKILAQIDKVAQARAELEKANARFLLGIRRVLTPDQWKKLQAEAPQPRPAGFKGGPGQPGPGRPGR